jgi:thioredoxin-like negative regulator of GroEL
MVDDSRPLLVFFGATHSGPARRMESLMAHLARKERARLRVTTIDVNQQPELAERFCVRTVPTLALIKGKRVVERLEGRASAPRIERMLAPHLVS